MSLMACLTETKDLFTFTWTMENFSMCAQRKGEFIKSPVFVVDGLEKSSWCLDFYPRGDLESDSEYIGLFLRLVHSPQTPEHTISVDFELELITNHPSTKPTKPTLNHEFTVGITFGYPKFKKRSNIMGCYPSDVMIIRCCMWLRFKNNPIELESGENSTNPNVSLGNINDLNAMKEMLCATNHDLGAFKCRFAPIESCARTQINVQHVSIVCPFENFCKDEFNEKWYLPIMSAMSTPTFILTIEKTEADADWISIKIRKINISTQHFVLGKITAFKQNFTVLSKEDEHFFEAVFEDGEQNGNWVFPLFIKANVLDDLNFHCEFSISTRGNESHTYEENKIVVGGKINQLTTETYSGLGKNFQDLHKCPNLPDVVLTCKGRIYHVHKTVLVAKSQGFKDRLENAKIFDIKDLQPDVLNEMLMFMYNDNLQNFGDVDVSDLYCAAHKYQIESLKQKCSSGLKSELYVFNVCDILILADEYKDTYLFSAVQNFIRDNAKEVFESSEWLDLTEDNSKLALNMSQLILKQNMNI